MTFADYLRLVRDNTTSDGLCEAVSRVAEIHGTSKHEATLLRHIHAMLTLGNADSGAGLANKRGFHSLYLCTLAAHLLGDDHPVFLPLFTDTEHPFGKYFRVHWLNLCIEEVAHNDDNPLPPFFTKEQLEELYEQYLLEQ